MCGRYTLSNLERIPDLFEVSDTHIDPRFNIAPSQEAPVIRLDGEGKRRLESFRWGLIPFWATDPKIAYRTINARAESVRTKPAFRQAFQERRCLVPADGYFEWRKLKGGKQPYLLQLKSRDPFAFAGLWERWKDPQGIPWRTFTIITTRPNPLSATIHDRMPAILEPEGYGPWLDPRTPPESLSSMLSPYPDRDMVAFPVSKLVNSPDNDRPECIEPMEPALERVIPRTPSLFD